MATFHEPKNISDVLVVKVADNYTLQSVQLQPVTEELPIGSILVFNQGQWGPISNLDIMSSMYSYPPLKLAVLGSHAEINSSAQKVLIIARAATVDFNALVLPEQQPAEHTSILLDSLELNQGIYTINAPAA